MVNQDDAIVTVWSDIGCPWATLALQTLSARAGERGVTLLVDHRAFPLELFNERPTPKAIIDMEVTAIAGLRPELGWQDWSGPESEYPVSTTPAMAAVQAAKDPSVGGLPASDQLDAALRRAYYEQSQCISVHARILRVAQTCPLVAVSALDAALQRGAGLADVFSQWGMARDLPVQGSPHFFVGGRYAEHNPGVTYHWTAPPGTGFPRLDEYDPAWADEVLDLIETSQVHGTTK
ncbi:DsbA family oxidoreductase [Flexivirga endophytica]|uniref:DsbA family oxidoreductase n=1 Tax=Flexivirga endophytica TaxID=1849103 RepID=UPI001E2976DD|nr:DsbA family protein [Flexivirga endophytica]